MAWLKLFHMTGARLVGNDVFVQKTPSIIANSSFRDNGKRSSLVAKEVKSLRISNCFSSIIQIQIFMWSNQINTIYTGNKVLHLQIIPRGKRRCNLCESGADVEIYTCIFRYNKVIKASQRSDSGGGALMISITN